MTGPCAPSGLPSHGQFPEIDPASDTGQRWWQRTHSWVRRSQGGFHAERYEVRPISDPVAKSYVERMHYSGSYVAASRRYGMFIQTDDGPDLVGVAVFSIPPQSRVLTNVFPDLAPSLNRAQSSPRWYRSATNLPVGQRRPSLVGPIGAATDRVISVGTPHMCLTH